MRAVGSWLVVALVVLVVACSVVYAQPESTVVTAYGSIIGQVFDNHRAFKGVPYMAPPVGKLRFMPPAQLQPWKPSVWNATYFRAGCPQHCVLPPHTCPKVQSEDCVYMNIYTPRVSHLTTKQPVMVFLPGGNFQQGLSGFEGYDGAFMVNRSNVIVITVNYRLGALGWLATPKTLKGNLGLMDQRMAFRWIANNIAAFGGDPTQITAFGQSAGATSIAVHLISPKSKGLFSKAIIESNPVQLPMKRHNDAAGQGANFLQYLGCSDDMACLQSKSFQDLVAAEVEIDKTVDFARPFETFYPWTPIIDPDEFPDNPLKVVQEGNFTHMPLMLGTLTNEALMFIYLAFKTPIINAEYVAAIEYIFGFESGLSVLEKYPPDLLPWYDLRPLMGVVGTDYIFTCANRNYTLNIANRDNPIYYYQFDHVISFPFWGPNFTECDDAVCHASELFFLFRSPLFYNEKFTPAESQLSWSMIDYWTNFARTGNPNKGRTVPVQWPLYNAQTKQNILFQTPAITVQSFWQKDICEFWDSQGYHHGW